jgi:hypothetical protein
MILSVLMFFIGIHFMIMLLAAGYRITDLWYRIGDFWKGILARIAGLILLGASYATSFSILRFFGWPEWASTSWKPGDANRVGTRRVLLTKNSRWFYHPSRRCLACPFPDYT